VKSNVYRLVAQDGDFQDICEGRHCSDKGVCPSEVAMRVGRNREEGGDRCDLVNRGLFRTDSSDGRRNQISRGR
jgi:hypothetical protein